MRIIAANSYHYSRGGDSSQFLTLVEALEQRGHDVAILSMNHPQNLPSAWSRYWLPNVEYRGQLSLAESLRLGLRSVRSAESARCMTRLIDDFRPDVVHFHSVQHQLTLSAVESAVRAAVPTVWTLHDYRGVCPASTLLRGSAVCERCMGGRFWHGITGRCKSGELSRSTAAVVESYLTRMKGTLSAVDCFVAPSRFLARKVLEMGLRPKHMEILPNPIPAELSPTPLASRQGLLYVGRLSSEKGIDCLIEAVSGIVDLTLRIVGDGPERPRLESLAAGLDSRVVFEGWKDAAEVRVAMAEAQLLCVPSLCYENCPGVVLEAMTAGLPVVASSLGGLPELLEGGRAGWLALPGDVTSWRRVIQEARLSGGETAKRAARAMRLARDRHDPRAHVERVERIYRSLSP